MKLTKSLILNALTVLVVSLMCSNPIQAGTRLAVFDFELIDLTALPNTQEEVSRTAAIKPLLDDAIGRFGDYESVAMANNDSGAVGYWLQYPDEAAKRGAAYGADWVVVGRHSKPGFLYSYLIAELVHVKTQRLCGSFAVELKGTHRKVMLRAVKSLAGQIDRAIRSAMLQYTGLIREKN